MAINLLLREIEKKEEIDLRMKPSLEIQDLQIGGHTDEGCHDIKIKV